MVTKWRTYSELSQNSAPPPYRTGPQKKISENCFWNLFKWPLIHTREQHCPTSLCNREELPVTWHDKLKVWISRLEFSRISCRTKFNVKGFFVQSFVDPGTLDSYQGSQWCRVRTLDIWGTRPQQDSAETVKTFLLEWISINDSFIHSCCLRWCAWWFARPSITHLASHLGSLWGREKVPPRELLFYFTHL